MGWLDIFKARPDRKPSEAPPDPVASNFARSGLPVSISYWGAVSAEKALKHPVIYRCVNKIAESVQQVAWFCEADPNVAASRQASKTTIEAVNSVLGSPNDIYSADSMKNWIAQNYALYGRAAFKVGVGATGMPNGIYPLDTRYVKVKLSNRGLIDQFIYGPSQDQVKIPPRRAASPGDAYAYMMAKPNLHGTLAPSDDASPLAAIGLPAQVIELLLQRAVDTASGHPNTKYIVVAEKTLTEQQRKDIGEHLGPDAEPGADQSGNVLILYNTSAKVEKLDNDLSDIHSKTPMDDMTRMIAGAFGIPISLLGLGAADAAKFAGNYSESRYSFFEDCIIPGYLTPIENAMTAALCPPGSRIRFDLDTIPAILERRVDTAAKLKDVPFLTGKEKRELVGFEPEVPDNRRDDVDQSIQPQV